MEIEIQKLAADVATARRKMNECFLADYNYEGEDEILRAELKIKYNKSTVEFIAVRTQLENAIQERDHAAA